MFHYSLYRVYQRIIRENPGHRAAKEDRAYGAPLEPPSGLMSYVTTLTRRQPDFNVRIRGGAPRVDVDAATFAFRLGSNVAIDGTGSNLGAGLTLGIGSNGAPSFSVRCLPPPSGGGGTGVVLSGTDQTLVAAGGPSYEPFLSMRTTVDIERLRVDSNGVFIPRLNAQVYNSLPHAFRGEPEGTTETMPPSAAALTDAYAALSNLVTQSVNQNVGSNFTLANDVVLASTEGEGRFRFDTHGHTTFGANGTASPCNLAFVWADNGAARDVMRLDGACNDLWVRGGAQLDGGVLQVGAARLAASGSNLGLNLPDGVAPVAALHVNGAVYTTEEMFGLSDARVKTAVRPLTGALRRVRGITGCTYAMRNDPPDRARRIGVIAQDVQRALPEAVHQGPDGRLSVAYGNLVALSLQAIKELEVEQRRLRARLRAMRLPSRLRRRS